jgi:DNA repair ATPase RecN
MTKDEFVNSANIGNTKIDYWNVQDKNVSEGTFLRYIGGPGRGQKERAEVSKNNLYTAMESYTKKILSDYYDSLGETVDNSVRIREIEVEMNTIDEERRRLSNVRSRVQDAIYYLEDVEDYMRGHTEEEGEYYSPFKDIVSREKLTELRGALNRIGERMETLDNVRREKNQEITNLQNNDGKNFAFYDLSTTS